METFRTDSKEAVAEAATAMREGVPWRIALAGPDGGSRHLFRVIKIERIADGFEITMRHAI